MKKILLLIVLLFPLISLQAQEQERVEFEIENLNKAEFKLVPIGSEGAIVIYNAKGEDRKAVPSYILKKVDANFKQTGKGAMVPQAGESLVDVVTDEANVYALFMGAISNHYSVFKIDKASLKTTVYRENNSKYMDFNSMEVLNGQLNLSIENVPNPSTQMFMVCISMPLCYIPLLFYKPKTFLTIHQIDFNKKTATKKEISLVGGKKMNLNFIDFTKNDSIGNFDVMYSISSKNMKDKRIIIRDITKGNVGKEKVVKLPNGKDIHTGRVFTLSSTEKLVFGQFKVNTKGKSSKEKRAAKTQAPGGFFITMFENDKQTFTKLTPFSTFKNFTMSIPSAARAKKESKGKSKTYAKRDRMLQAILSFAFHNVVVKDDEIIIIAEPYYPTYHTEYRVVYVNGRPTTQAVTVFDGYRFLGVVVIAYDLEGNFKWENGFKIANGPLSFSTSCKFNYYEVEDDGFKIVYNAMGKIYTKTIYNDKVAEEVELTKVSTKTTDKKVVNYSSRITEMSGTEYWYDNYYLAYGIQSITVDKKKSGKNNDDDKKKRKVFYLNRIELEN